MSVIRLYVVAAKRATGEFSLSTKKVLGLRVVKDLHYRPNTTVISCDRSPSFGTGGKGTPEQPLVRTVPRPFRLSTEEAPSPEPIRLDLVPRPTSTSPGRREGLRSSLTTR